MAGEAEPSSDLPGAVVVLATDAYGRVLFGPRLDNGKYTLPAGGLNPGEPPAEGARRELKEETGLDAVSMTPLHVIAAPGAVVHCFSAHVNGVPHGRNDPDQEVAEWKFVDVSDGVPKNIWNRLAGPPGDDNLVRQLFDMKKSERTWLWDAGFADLSKAEGAPDTWLAGAPCLYDSAEDCPDIDCSHHLEELQKTGEGDPETWYHITDNPRFALDPQYAPEDNSISIHSRAGQKGVYLTKNPERWVNGHNYVRPYVAELQVHPSIKTAPGTHGRYGGEMFVPAPHFDKVQVTRVIPIDAYAREEYGEPGWIESHHGTAFDTDQPLPAGHPRFPNYRYPGPDVRQMPKEQHDRHAARWVSYMKENRGIDVTSDEPVEKALSKSEAQALLAHPDPRERALALKLDGATPADVATAILDPDPWVWRAAFNHEHSTHAHDVLAASHRDAAGVPIYDRHDELVGDPRLRSAHLPMMYRAAQYDQDLPDDVKARRLAMLSQHPLMDLHDVGEPGPGDGAPPLQKHWAHDHLRAGSSATTAMAGAEDVPPHLQHFRQAWDHQQASAHPLHDSSGDLYTAGTVSPKAVYRMDVPGYDKPQAMMVKPYAEAGFPLSGWAELTNQSLYHAAGIGHLHQKVIPVPHGHGSSLIPAIAIHVEPAEPIHNFDPVSLLRHRPVIAEEARRIAVMDYLSNNNDRHSNNVMIRGDHTPLAIDHGASYDYRGRVKAPIDYVNDTMHVLGSPGYDHGGYIDTLKWWKKVAPDVKRAFQDRLDLIRSPMTQEQMIKGFAQRTAVLDALAKQAAGGTPPDLNAGADRLAKKLGDAGFLDEELDDHHRRPDDSHLSLVGAHPEVHDATVKDFEENLNHSGHVVKPVAGTFVEGAKVAGAEAKSVYKHGDRHFMVKRYDSGINHAPTGWAESTSQALYHAAGIGHLHQPSHVTLAGPDHGPALVIHMEPNALTASMHARLADSAGHSAASPVDLAVQHHGGDLRRIAVMDFVTGNHDRHGENVLLRDDGSPLAIDHGQAFYHDFGFGHGVSHYEDQDIGDLVNDNYAFRKGGPPTPQDWAWFDAAKPAIMQKMQDHLETIPDPTVREGVEMSFNHRLQQLEQLKHGWEPQPPSQFADLVPEHHAATTPGPVTGEEAA